MRPLHHHRTSSRVAAGRSAAVLSRGLALGLAVGALSCGADEAGTNAAAGASQATADALASRREQTAGQQAAPGGPAAPADDGARAPADAAPADAAPAGPAPPLVAFLGDSLTAGFGLDPSEAYPALLQEALAERGRPVEILNAGVSGDTTAGGRTRADWVLRRKPDAVVLCLGGNDGLRGLPVTMIRANLRLIIERCQAAGAAVLLVGMKLPPNYGWTYTQEFKALYAELADELDVAFLPFLLEGVAMDPALMLGDGLHPNAEGQRVIARHVLPALEALLDG